MIYLDYNATTPVDPVVLDQMLPWMSDRFWNASSSHLGGQEAAEAVDRARGQVADLIGARPAEIVWTSGATEANNLALKGVVELAPEGRRRVVVSATEHKAVLDVVEWLGAMAVPATVVPVRPDGSVDADCLATELGRNDVAIVSVMAANNETGVLADLQELSALVHEHGARLHSDATQLVGKLPFDVGEAGVDMASLSAHKMYGPKGVGALYVSRRVDLAPIIHGGGHERGRRSGTVNVPGAVGLGAAAERAKNVSEQEAPRQRALRDRLVAELGDRLGGVSETTTLEARLPNTASLRFRGVDADALLANVPSLAISTGSACTSSVPAPSHVLTAMGLTHDAALECVRVSVGRPTSERDVDEAVDAIEDAVSRIRRLNGGRGSSGSPARSKVAT